MRKHLKLIVSLVLVSSVALAGAISVEVGGYQYLKGLVLTAPTGENALRLNSGAKICLNAACSGSIQESSTVVTVGNSLQSPRVTGTITDSNALTVGASNAGPGRAFILSEATDNAPTVFTTNHAVVGRVTASGAGSGALFIQYNSSDNSSLIGSLSPAVAWRTLRLAASTVVAQDPAGVAQLTITNATGALQTNGTVTSNGALALTGVATGSLPTCNATAPPTGTRGAIQYDTTLNVLKVCNGTSWLTIATVP